MDPGAQMSFGSDAAHKATGAPCTWGLVRPGDCRPGKHLSPPW